METDSELLDNLIEVMNQLKELEIMMHDLDDVDNEVLMGLILALIKNTKVPDVTILPNIGSIAIA